jgi:hypothetical protein
VPVLFLVFDSVIKLMRITPVLDSFNQLGYPDSLSLAIGILERAPASSFCWFRERRFWAPSC